MEVAPFAGAWIEIVTVKIPNASARMSLPSRERGLKSDRAAGEICKECVAPFAGAWIEIIFYVMDIMRMIVAPFAGAWIEITMQTIFF